MESNGQHGTGASEIGAKNLMPPPMGLFLPWRVLARVALDFAEALSQETVARQVFAWHAGEMACRCTRNNGVSGEAECRQLRDQLIAWIQLASERGWVSQDRVKDWLMDLSAVAEERSREVMNLTDRKLTSYHVRRRGWAFGARSRCEESRKT